MDDAARARLKRCPRGGMIWNFKAKRHERADASNMRWDEDSTGKIRSVEG
jgi:hypothetical protein